MVTADNTIQPSLDYFAGHFDGEGCIYMRMRPDSQRARLSITITAGYRPILDAYRARFGGQVTRSTLSVNMQLWRWMLSSLPEMQRFLAAIIPFLHEKREQAEVALEYLRVRLQYSTRGGNGRGRRDAVAIMLDSLSQSTCHKLRLSKNQPDFSPAFVGVG